MRRPRPVVAGPDRLPEAAAPIVRRARLLRPVAPADGSRARRSRRSAASSSRTSSFTRRCASACGPTSLRSARALGYFSASERRLVHAYVGVRPQHEEWSASASTRRRSRRIRGTSRIRPTRSRTRTTPGDGRRGRGSRVSRRPRRAVPAAPSSLRPVRALRRPRRAGQRLRGDARLLRRVCGLRRRHGARADGREDDEGAGGALPPPRRRAAGPRADDRVRSRRRHDRAGVGRSARAAAAREPRGRHAGARQRAQPAAVEHCRRANAGLYYANRDEFVGALRLLDDQHAPARAARRERPRATSGSTTAGTPCSAASSG